MISCELYLLFSVNYPEMKDLFQGTIHIASIPAGMTDLLCVTESEYGYRSDFTSFRPFNMLSK